MSLRVSQKYGVFIKLLGVLTQPVKQRNSVCCLIWHMFKGCQEETSATSLLPAQIFVYGPDEAIGKRYIQNPVKHLVWSVLRS